ncbi:DUF11 domain-containing protein [Streptomyces rectiverticillatus]|uniref:DUF7927 domain-containing protein n=1 Tax=Streptomyces rectiverticillatus TaxID=173860 RepID=UPI0015C31120|nr:DUF11 domain-containing protein [Streptomyces rectiverticillatus]QLE72497.1 DUF11 domain-containing protein [Streptomyces rectiverticillatus]
MPDRLPRVLTLVAFLVGVGVITGAAMVPTAPFDTMATSIRIAKSVDRTSAHPGDTVNYTVTVTNTGTTAISGAAISDDLSNVVDDATFNSATSDRGTTSFSSPTLQWQGDLASGAKATISYSVRVANPPTGDHSLTNTVTSTTAGNNCPSGSTDTACTTSTPVS